MKGGYSAVAAYLSALTGRSITRQQVYLWNRRRTLNAAGQAFPSPVESDPVAKPRQPRKLFDMAQVARWYRAGPPAPWTETQRVAGQRARQAAGVTVRQ